MADKKAYLTSIMLLIKPGHDENMFDIMERIETVLENIGTELDLIDWGYVREPFGYAYPKLIELPDIDPDGEDGFFEILDKKGTI